MATNLTTLAGANYSVPLIPSAFEPAFAACSTSSNVFVYSHNKQLLTITTTSSGEYSGTWNGNYSGTPSSNSSWTYSGTTQAGFQGHNYMSIATPFNSNGGYTYSSPGYQSASNYLYGGTNNMCSGIWVNKTKRDNLCIQRINAVNSLYRTQVSSMGYGALMAPMTSTGDMTGGTAAGTANGYNANQMYGLLGYNESTKMWVTGQYVSGSDAQMFVYKNIEPPSMTTDLQNYWSQFNHSTKITVPFTVPSTGALDPVHWKIIPLDNGNIAVIFKYQSNYLRYILFTGNNGVNSTSWTQSTVQDLNLTTSYHNTEWNDQIPFQVSYDGKYVFVYTQYYYYLAGIMGFIIRVSDGKRLTIDNANTTYAYCPVMISANNMIVSIGTNTDGGSGISLLEYDLPYLFDVYNAGQNVWGAGASTNIDCPSSSTNYSMIWSVPSLIPRFNKGVI